MKRYYTVTPELAIGYGAPTKPEYLGTIHHTKHGVSVGVNHDYYSTGALRKYLTGQTEPNYPMPATLTDAIISNWVQRSYWMAGTLPNFVTG